MASANTRATWWSDSADLPATEAENVVNLFRPFSSSVCPADWCPGRAGHLFMAGKKKIKENTRARHSSVRTTRQPLCYFWANKSERSQRWTVDWWATRSRWLNKKKEKSRLSRRRALLMDKVLGADTTSEDGRCMPSDENGYWTKTEWCRHSIYFKLNWK